MGSLYSISGLFSNISDKKIGAPFGGFFMRKTENSESLIRGSLIDCYGFSDMKGKINQSMLEFNKEYRKGGIMKYKFSFNEEKNLWEGGYFVDGWEGDAICCIYEILKGLNPSFEEQESIKRDLVRLIDKTGYMGMIRDA